MSSIRESCSTWGEAKWGKTDVWGLIFTCPNFKTFPPRIDSNFALKGGGGGREGPEVLSDDFLCIFNYILQTF